MAYMHEVSHNLANKNRILNITKKLICPEDKELVIQTTVYSYHRPGQKALEIFYYDDNGEVKGVGRKAISIFSLMILVISLPISYIVVNLIKDAIMLNY